MSRLRELRLHGFKTFADPTRFAFEQGVTAVIGPNGSGKSNMADAVRWVLGEQSNRSLRTRKADDVIFAGSQQRKPQGMAEAVLTLDNSDGWLPIAFGEVSIGRRAYRSGEGEYLINGARARLRDVVELLGEGRLGANELVVVGQGTVDAALSLRPEERRQLFEEAAGVKNLQVRKNEALSRLTRAGENLGRLSDLVAELRPQVRRLAQQAAHQQEHDGLRMRIRGLVDESHRRREQVARSALGEARRQAAAAESALQAFRDEQSAGRAAVEAAERSYWQADAAARAAATRHEATREAAIRADGRLEAVATRRAELAAAVQQAELDHEQLTIQLAGLPDDADDDALLDALARASTAEARWQQASQVLAAADARMLEAEEYLARVRQQRGARLAAEAKRADELAAAAARRERIEREMVAAELEQRQATSQADEARAALKTATDARQASQQRLETAAVAAGAAAEHLEVQQRETGRLRERRDALEAQLAGMRERAELGNELAAILTAAGWSRLLDEIAAPEEAWPAIEAVVGGELGDALLWGDGDPAARLADHRGTVRLLDGRGDANLTGREQALAAFDATRTVAEWIGTQQGPAVLHRAVLVDDLPALLSGWRGLPAGWLAVTRHGDLADARGVVALRGRANPPAAAAARDHARRRDLADALVATERELDTVSEHLLAAGEGVTDARRTHEEFRAVHDDDERRMRHVRGTADAAEARAARSARELARLRAELAQARAAEATSAAPVPADAGDDSASERLVADAEEARAARLQAASGRDAALAAWQTARTAAGEAEASSVGRRQERGALEARIAQIGAGLPGLRQALDAVRQQLEESRALADAARAQDDAAAEGRAAAEVDRERQRAGLLELEQGSGAETRLGELERVAQATAIEASRCEEAIVGLQRERELALEGFEPAHATEPMMADVFEGLLALDDQALESDLRRVRRTLGQIGSVNPFAVEEHAELAARLTDLETQDADLRAAGASTQELIDTLDGEIGQRFNAAFAAIADRFDEFCRLLFAGGSASLQMADGADGETPGGIEIVVRPPGKRPQRLAMLSGGERALTGVALLFAMLSVNPVPFCVLDEVDAALDEANIGRFADALRRLAETIDFVVITHNRATMEVADTIYGVTMTDAAVSRVLSLRLADLPVAEVPAAVSA